MNPISDRNIAYKTVVDSWNYIHTPDDDNRKSILLSELPKRDYNNVLSIGCGRGFITKDLPGNKIIGIDISEEALTIANLESKNDNIEYFNSSIFDLPELVKLKHFQKFDLIVITGVIYSAQIGHSHNLVYLIIDEILSENGILVCAHIAENYKARFPYLNLKSINYNYREHNHLLEIYVK